MRDRWSESTITDVEKLKYSVEAYVDVKRAALDPMGEKKSSWYKINR